MDNLKILIIIPAYNEEQSIGYIIDELKDNHLYDYVVINDGSSDNTESVLKSKKANYINQPYNTGIGCTVQTGYKYALNNGYDVAVQLDGDGQHNPSDLEKIIRPILEEKMDVVIGSRYIDKNGFQSTIFRRVGIKLLSGIIFIMTGTKILDCTSGFRAVSRNGLILFSKDYPNDYPEPESIVAAINAGLRVKEIPVVMKERRNGKSSIDFKKSIYYMIKVSLAIIFRKLQKGEAI